MSPSSIGHRLGVLAPVGKRTENTAERPRRDDVGRAGGEAGDAGLAVQPQEVEVIGMDDGIGRLVAHLRAVRGGVAGEEAAAEG